MINITFIIGSYRTNRQTPKLSYYIIKKFEKILNIKIKIIDIKTCDLPIMDDNLIQKSDELLLLQKNINKSDGIVIISPEYNGSIPGSLKNFLDYFHTEFKHKTLGIVTCSSGNIGGIYASISLMQWAFHMLSYVCPYKVTVPNINTIFNEKKIIKNNIIENDINIFVKEFTHFTKIISYYKSINQTK